MKNRYYQLIIFGIIIFCYGCKKEDNDEPRYPYPAFDFYLVDKSTGENLFGEDEDFPYQPGQVSLYVIYDNDTLTKENYQYNSFYLKKEEIGYFYRFIHDHQDSANYIIYLDELKPDTISIFYKRKENQLYKVYINNEFEAEFTAEEYYYKNPYPPLYKFEKEL